MCAAAPRRARIGATLSWTAAMKGRTESVMSGLITASSGLALVFQATVLGGAALVGLATAVVVNPLLPF